MSAFKLRYREQPTDEIYPDETLTKPGTKARSHKLLLETSIAAICMLSVAGNVISYTHIKDLEQAQDKHLLRYDSLLSAKLLADQELVLLKARLHGYPADKALIRLLPQQETTLPEERSAPD
jgi:hypothetical protein